jgi:uncharacterized membrane protein YeaQ/YmgE (transglycosylase-associated protein family)
MIASLIEWVVLGLVAGFLARLLHPGRDHMGLLGTILLGVAGSLVGGGIAYILKLGTSPYEPGSWIMATLGAIILLALGWFGTRTRLTTTPM